MIETGPQEITEVSGTQKGLGGLGARIWRRLLHASELGVLIALVVLSIATSLASPYFLQTDNILNVLRGIAVIGIMAFGETLVIMTGSFDLSIGSVLALSSMIAAKCMTEYHMTPLLAILAGLVTGAVCGAVNGLLVTRVRINSFIATLAMLSIARGLTYLAANGSNIQMKDAAVVFLGAGYIGRIPFAVIEMFFLLIVAYVFLRYTVAGRRIAAVGGNERAARLSGVRVERIRMLVFIIMGALAAFAGIVKAATLSTAAVSAGTGNELDVIAAVVIGGASLAGGTGSVIGAVLGAAMMGVLHNAFVMLGFPLHIQTVSIGLVIIFAATVDRLRTSRSR
jgi:ribose transport system permease protein